MVTAIGVVGTMVEDAIAANIPKQFVTENSYILDPESYGEVQSTSLQFSYCTSIRKPSALRVAISLQVYVVRQDKVQKIIIEALEQRLAGQVYDPVKGAQVE